MPDAVAPRTVHLLICGEGAVRFAVPLDRIGRVLEHSQLPTQYRSVNVPRLFAGADLEPEADRYAEVPAAGAGAHLRLGPSAAAEEITADRLQTVPHILARTAARWGWSGILPGDPDAGVVYVYVVVLDPERLSAIGAPLTREASA